ncbi:MAG TPA: hypothetical protein VJI15_02240 [Candidatus Nanoarchaeia archaeon]|nr:hypothetical protein [Candidatus Nanoarchaeia archaeon]
MITQLFLDRFEAGLLKSYNRYHRQGPTPVAPGKPEFMKTANAREDFLQKFMATFSEQHNVLLEEVQRGGHREAEKIVDQINLLVRNKMAAADFGKAVPDERAFKKAILELKTEVRRTFY